MKKIKRMAMTMALALSCLAVQPQARAIGLVSTDRERANPAFSIGSILDSIEGWFYALFGHTRG